MVSILVMVKAIGFTFFLIGILAAPQFALGSNHYTARQLDALAERVGGQFWLNAPSGKPPPFSSAPSRNAAPVRLTQDDESFEIVELVGRANKEPFYKVKFQSGKIAYLRPEIFNEEVNASIIDRDPRAEERLKSEQAADEEKQRVAWINAQGWPQNVKDSAIKKRPVLGLTGGEVKQVMGVPRRVAKTGASKVRGAAHVNEERWYYPDGTVLLFRNDILSQADYPSGK